jgi:hypothetical protein
MFVYVYEYAYASAKFVLTSPILFLHYTHRSSTEIAVSRNVSYVTTPSIASGAQAIHWTKIWISCM